MNEPAKFDFSEGFAAALDWWRDAGVDCAFHDDAQAWIAPLAPEDKPGDKRGARPLADEPARAPAQPAPPTLATTPWPQELTGFAEWWLTAPELEEGRTHGRVAPRGASQAELMVVVPDPEREDAERLLSGPQGRLLDAMLRAFGVPAERAYVASVLPRHTPAADWRAIGAAGYGELLRHHVALVAPSRLIVLGANVLPLIGHDPPQRPAVLREFNHGGTSTPMLAGRSLSALIERPRWKAELWKAWLDWTSPSAGAGTTGIGQT